LERERDIKRIIAIFCGLFVAAASPAIAQDQDHRAGYTLFNKGNKGDLWYYIHNTKYSGQLYGTKYTEIWIEIVGLKSRTMILWRYDCARRTITTMSDITYNEFGDLLQSDKTNEALWKAKSESVIPNTVGQIGMSIACE